MAPWSPATDPLLATIRRALERAERPGILVDVDDVLADTTVHRFRLMARRHGLPPGTTVEQLLERHHWAEDVPHWQTPAALADLDSLRSSDSHHRALGPLPGSAAGAAELHRLTPIALAVTNRPSTMRRSTASWMREHGFPDIPVMTRPAEAADTPAADWKLAVVAFLAPHVLGIVDDNAGLLAATPWDLPARIYVFGERATSDGVVHPRGVRTRTWADLHDAVRADLATRGPRPVEAGEDGVGLG